MVATMVQPSYQTFACTNLHQLFLDFSFQSRGTCLVTSTRASAKQADSFRWANDGTSLSLSKKFILPYDKRPKLSDVANSASIPLIDMGESNDTVVQKISSACEEYGFFQIINHGVPKDLCQSTLSATTEFFHLPPEEKGHLVSEDSSKDVRICNHYRKEQGQEKITMWSEVFKHPWHPVDDFTNMLPLNATKYCENIAAYAKETGILMASVLSLMSRGLGLDKHCLQMRIGENALYRTQANFYPPCSDPDLTLGLGVHTDRDALTVVLQSSNVKGLQVMKDDRWLAVDPVPHALVINLGDQLRVLSNGRYKSVLHRVVTNKSHSRTSLAMFHGPNKGTLIGPVEQLIDEQHPACYRSYHFADFLEEFRRQEGNRRRVKEAFELC